jgi:hypothetical protein
VAEPDQGASQPDSTRHHVLRLSDRFGALRVLIEAVG